MSLGLSLPPFDGVRLATSEDLPRIATVAAAGFFHSPSFQFQRVHHDKYPDDTLLSYRTEYHAAILDPASVVLVTEDTLINGEGESVYKALQAASAYSPGAAFGVKTVVGVASINIKPGSSYIGQFHTRCSVDLSTPRTTPDSLNRDISPAAAHAYNQVMGPAKAKHLAGQMRLSTLAVHPAYWRRGHASRLVRWCTYLADLDGVPVGISAVPMGANIAAKAGFEDRELVRVKRSRPHDEGTHKDDPGVGDVELWFAIRPPTGSPISGESATSSLESMDL